MPERGIKKPIKTLGDLRELLAKLEDLEDEYEISFCSFIDDFEIEPNVDISYSDKTISFDLKFKY